MQDFNLKEFLVNMLSKAVLIFITFISPVVGILIAVGLAIGIDTIFGVWKIKKTEPSSFNSTTLRTGLVTKMFFYQSVVLTLYVLDGLILMEFSKLFNPMDYLITKLAAVALITIEGVSINENFKAVTGKSIMQGIKDFINSYNIIKKEIN